jgi:hypothetical protein
MGTPRCLLALRSRDGARVGCAQSDAAYSDKENDEKKCAVRADGLREDD